eukprot:TRINITY_DN49_c0_g2_i1.p1 TRINITY_DN49_c0_g2~~TRINITY_DN49_c0_g2_i1.p1  ORF type:complete len:107 (+),score=48.28 TRINITY_DN49_c0_g2_i1:271-591(+)
MFAPKNAKCHVCAKTVYINDLIVADEKSYHKSCFRCAECNNVLRLGNYASLNGRTYCKPHFKQLFKLKGNYNEGFGQEKLTEQWANNRREGGTTTTTTTGDEPNSP